MARESLAPVATRTVQASGESKGILRLQRIEAGVATASKKMPGVDESGQSLAGTGKVSPQQAPPVESALLRKSVSDVNEYVQNVQRNLEFSIDKDSGDTVIRVVDAQTGEVIRQLPPERVLQMAKNLDQMRSMIVSEKV